MKEHFNTLFEKGFPCLLLSHPRPNWLSQPINTEKHLHIAKAQPLELQDYTFEYFTSAASLPDYWTNLAPQDDFFLQIPYLSLLEECPPSEMSFHYLIFKRNDEAVGIAIFQGVYFDAAKDITPTPAVENTLWAQLNAGVKNWIARQLHFRLLICGNMLITGQHGFAFQPEISNDTAISLLHQGLNKVCNHLDAQGQRIDGCMIKDVPNGKNPSTSLTSRGYTGVTFQPNMILQMDPAWQTVEDYLDTMSSKYRVRARRARKAVTALRRVALDAGGIAEYRDELYDFYHQIANNAEFNMVDLHPAYFEQLSQAFPHRFRLWGYFKGEELIGFCTTLLNGEELEAHFLGFNEENNRRYQLYLNMLYDMVADGIDAGVTRIVFARTAMEIKSSVGAEAHMCYCYLRHRTWWINAVLGRLVKLLEPRVDWTPRHPFRKELN